MVLPFYEVDGPTTPSAPGNSKVGKIVATDGSQATAEAPVLLDESGNFQAQPVAYQHWTIDRLDVPTRSPTQLFASPLAGRKRITIKNNGDDTIEVGHSNALAIGLGLALAAGESWTEALGANVQVWVVANSGTQDVIGMEFA